MFKPLVCPDLLARSDKILFVAHLALGDYAYLQNCFRAFARAYPHLSIHLWVDERRRTSRASEWEHLKKYSLYDWLAACPFIAKVYNQTYSPALFRQSIQEAQHEAYPIVVSLAVLERHRYAMLARKISAKGFVAGQKKRVRLLDLYKHLIYRKLDAAIPAYTASAQQEQHISDIYADWFQQLFGLEIPPDARFPFVDIPEQWLRHAREQIAAWGFMPTESRARHEGKIVFANAFSKSSERNWPLERVFELVRAMQRQDAWRNAGFIINVVPEEMERARKLFVDSRLERAHLFSAEENFFQLPAILRLCDLVISVETAVMHLANAVHAPVIALMRQKNPEWAPIDKAGSTVITVARRNDWVDAITTSQVMAVLEQTVDADARPPSPLERI